MEVGSQHGATATVPAFLTNRLDISRTPFGRWWIVGVKARRDQQDQDAEPGIEIDWRGSAPRWLLIVALIASVGFNGLLGTAVVGLVVDRWRMIEAAQRDPLWDLVGKLSATQAEQGVRLRQHEESLRDMATLSARMGDMQAEFRVLNERLRRRGF